MLATDAFLLPIDDTAAISCAFRHYRRYFKMRAALPLYRDRFRAVVADIISPTSMRAVADDSGRATIR